MLNMYRFIHFTPIHVKPNLVSDSYPPLCCTFEERKKKKKRRRKKRKLHPHTTALLIFHCIFDLTFRFQKTRYKNLWYTIRPFWVKEIALSQINAKKIPTNILQNHEIIQCILHKTNIIAAYHKHIYFVHSLFFPNFIVPGKKRNRQQRNEKKNNERTIFF